MNDLQFVEAARVLAERAMQASERRQFPSSRAPTAVVGSGARHRARIVRESCATTTPARRRDGVISAKQGGRTPVVELAADHEPINVEPRRGAANERHHAPNSCAAQGRSLALAQLLNADSKNGLPHFAPKVKRAIYLHMVGAPPQLETFDYKPGMKDWFDKDQPESIRQGQRLTTMTSNQSRFPIAPSVFQFAQHGKSGAHVSELLPYTAKMVDDIAIIRSMHTEAINHEPAMTFIQTGFMIAGKPCIGSWMAYGLGSMNKDLPTFVVLNATHSNPKANVQAISARLWSSGFLSGQYSGVSLRSGGDPVLYINNPDGVPREVRRRMLDGLGAMNQLEAERYHDPETRVRIEQYEMAFRMQASVPELTDLSKESESTFKLYGEDARKGGTLPTAC